MGFINESGATNDSDVDQDGIPPAGRRRGNNKIVNYLGIAVIVAAGVAVALAVTGDKDKKPIKNDEKQDAVTNNLPPLVIPAVPERIAFAPEKNNNDTRAKPIQYKNAGPAEKPVATWQDRKMGGVTLVEYSVKGSSSSSNAAPQNTQTLNEDGFNQFMTPGGASGASRGEFASKLEPTAMKGSMAALLPNRNYIIAKGTSLDCALETALDSTVPGMTTCRLTRDVYSDNGQVVLLDRGTQLVGEYQGGIKQGQARLFVLWSRAKTPNGVIVTLNSPGSDALGRSGLEGWVDTHFIDRFGAAIMISLLKDSYAYLIARQSSNNGGGAQNTLVLGNTAQGTDKMAEKALEASVNIPPTLMKNQGDHIQVMLARDLDFSSVYGLQVGQ